MKVREIITVKEWVNGSGCSCETTISNQIISVADDALTSEMDWSWYEASDAIDGDDLIITVRYYAEDDDDLTAPLAEWSAWQSEICA